MTNIREFIKYATVTNVSTGGVNVMFDGEGLQSSILYVTVCECHINDRVVMVYDGSTWLIMGVVKHG